MARAANNLKFGFSFAELVAQVLEKQTYLQRDAAELDARGVTAARLANLDTLLADFFTHPEAGVMSALVSVAVSKRNIMYDNLMARLRDVAGVASMALGVQSAEYRSFRYAKIHELGQDSFLFRAETMCDRADEFQAILTPRGISAADILAIRNLLPTFKNLIKAVDNANFQRDISTDKRHKSANDLYTELVDLAGIAKIYYQDRDEAKYNDYVIYATSETAQTRTGRLSANEKKTRKWEALSSETEFIAENESAGELKMYFSKSDNGKPATVFKMLAPHSKQTLNIASELGYNKETNATHFVLQNMSNNEVVYRVRIE